MIGMQMMIMMASFSQYSVMFGRLGEIFKLEEHKRTRQVDCSHTCIQLENATFSWDFKLSNNADSKFENFDQPILENINLNLKKDSLLLVVGKVGSGKTSLLYSIMEENRLKSGTLNIKGRIAYVEQEPFIISGTIQENITFGIVYDSTLFNQCISAACLDQDLK